MKITKGKKIQRKGSKVVWLDSVPKKYGELYKDLKDLSGNNSYTINVVSVKGI